MSEFFQKNVSGTADPANVEKPEEMDLESLPSSQATIADEEEPIEYFEDDDDKCSNCKIVALKMKMLENKNNQQKKEIKQVV